MRTDVPQLLQGMDVFFFPSLYEGLAVVIVEAQAAGLPIVASSEIALSQDVYFSDLIQTLSLLSKIEDWVDALIKASKKNHNRVTCNLLAHEGKYDVVKNAKILEEIYRGGGSDYK